MKLFRLREFLYVDTDKVRGMLAQLDGGVAEEERSTSKNDKRTEGGVKGFASHYQTWGEEKYVNRSLGDALFPTLEAALETEGMILELSEELRDPEYWSSDALRSTAPPGTMVRIEAPGSLFDARYIASSLAGFAATYLGLEGIGVDMGDAAPRGGGRHPARSNKPPKPKDSSAQPEIEDAIAAFGPMPGVPGGTKIDEAYMKALVKISRGLFLPGLHLNLKPTDSDQLTIGARLQEGRQFLDSDPEVLFARYGTGPQLWTIVGTVGHYAGPDDHIAPSQGDLVRDDGVLVRGRTGAFINSFMRFLGSLGFADVPQYPGFTIVPMAVYRSVLRPSGKDLVAT